MQVQNLPYAEYSRIAAGFYPSKFNAAEWVSAFKASGAKYITITSRHHDGFSMFGTKASPYNIVDATPFKRDVIAELSKECQRQGIKLHFYYSHLDWGREDYYPLGRTGWGTGRQIAAEGKKEHPATQLKRSYLDFMNTQLTELLTKYGPIGAIWFDGVWDQDAFPREEQPNIWNLYEQYALIHRLQPACLIGNNHHLLPFEGEDIQIFEQDIPGQNEAGLSGQEISRLPLETCKTMNNSWGYNMRDKNYMSPEGVVQYLVRTAGKGANLLLNVGPRPDGTLPEEALERLKYIGEWLGTYGVTVYGTDGGCIDAQEWGVTTQRGKTLYVHLLPQADKALPEVLQLDIPKAKNKLKAAKLFDGEAKVPFKQTSQGITLALPQLAAVSPDIILELTFAKEL
jgi:alpha-L-fucosidase